MQIHLSHQCPAWYRICKLVCWFVHSENGATRRSAAYVTRYISLTLFSTTLAPGIEAQYRWERETAHTNAYATAVLTCSTASARMKNTVLQLITAASKLPS